MAAWLPIYILHVPAAKVVDPPTPSLRLLAPAAMASTGPHPTSARAAPPSPHSSSSSTNSNADLIILSSSDDDDRAAGTRKMRRAPIYQKWRFSDEVDLLTWLAAERRRCGELPSWSELFKALTKKERDAPALKRANLTAPDLKKKVDHGCRLEKKRNAVERRVPQRSRRRRRC
ncbi:uncharacterized protein LOC112899775 isoform X2 [Panicum hallii]|uniref:uncharacterized protein LOC112899775 isoform X2 n=1 Tax=Panicum hallii TaxID=206008 RepID=UPI000DF4DC8C|nr:uncharacterized protein LOC112899775 isoform X2 [Panicum hallii]